MLSSVPSMRSRGSAYFDQAPKVQYPTSASDYKVLEEIGRGVSAKVYRAECLSLNETVAVKMMDLEDQDPGHLEEIRREVASMSMVSHPNLVTGREGGESWDVGERMGDVFSHHFFPSHSQVLKCKKLSASTHLCSEPPCQSGRANERTSGRMVWNGI